MAARVALITGCSSGIGHAAALRLHAAGFQVYAARRPESLAGLAAAGISTARLDVTDQARRQFDTNFFGLAALSQLVIPGMRAHGGGRIINVSSVFGRLAVPGGAYYAASKHAVEAFTDALRLELPRSA
jgi:NAD(P)-dependent dehydrogenase (short-subunit alcohol dehydrogenase family)